MTKPLYDSMTTRVIPGLKASYQIVSLPYWAWFWLEDLMKKHNIDYRGLYDRFNVSDDVALALKHLAELHLDEAMRKDHNLANDNNMQNKDLMVLLCRGGGVKKIEPFQLPKIYKLFGFVPCPTTLAAVWQRRHYNDSNRLR